MSAYLYGACDSVLLSCHIRVIRRFSDVFRGYVSGTLVENALRFPNFADVNQLLSTVSLATIYVPILNIISVRQFETLI